MGAKVSSEQLKLPAVYPTAKSKHTGGHLLLIDSVMDMTYRMMGHLFKELCQFSQTCLSQNFTSNVCFTYIAL